MGHTDRCGGGMADLLHLSGQGLELHRLHQPRGDGTAGNRHRLCLRRAFSAVRHHQRRALDTAVRMSYPILGLKPTRSAHARTYRPSSSARAWPSETSVLSSSATSLVLARRKRRAACSGVKPSGCSPSNARTAWAWSGRALGQGRFSVLAVGAEASAAAIGSVLWVWVEALPVVPDGF